MRRDMEYARSILAEIEASDDGSAKISPSRVFDDARFRYHSWLLYDSGLICGIKVDAANINVPCIIPMYLTSAGHDFLDASRDPTTWEKALRRLQKVGMGLGSVTVDVLKALLIDTAKRELEIQ